MMLSSCGDNEKSDLHLPMTLVEGRFDSTESQGIAHGGRDDSKKGLYFTGNGPAKKIIGVGKFSSYSIDSIGNLERFLAFVKEKRHGFYIVEGAENMGNELLRNVLDVIDGAHCGRSSPISVSIVENGSGLLKRLEQEYKRMHFYRARSIGSDTIDAGLPSYLVERA